MDMTFDNSTHQHWEDWASFGLGCLILIAPWLTGNSDSQYPVLNALTVGMVVVSVSVLELSALQRWEEWIEAATGTWFAASAWALNFSDLYSLAVLQVLLGGAVAILAFAELWQDRKGIPPVRGIRS